MCVCACVRACVRACVCDIHVLEYSCNGLGVMWSYPRKVLASFDCDSEPHVDSVGTLGHTNNVNLHLDYQYIHRWSGWEETKEET